MRLISWNVNGIRAMHRKGAWEKAFKLRPDVLLIQETKASPEQLTDELLSPPGYSATFASSVTRKGYSGVATYIKDDGAASTSGFGKSRFDEQGRVVITRINNFLIANVYVPNGASKTAPLDYKLDFYKEFLQFLIKQREKGLKIIVGTDFNVAHTEIDLARPKENAQSIGFLPEERAWVDTYIEKGFIDSFRTKHPKARNAYTYWDQKTRARERNVGWRIDYFFIDKNLKSKITKAEILSDIEGSDHCPILLELKT